jgi:hypothetical protein
VQVVRILAANTPSIDPTPAIRITTSSHQEQNLKLRNMAWLRAYGRETRPSGMTEEQYKQRGGLWTYGV